MPFFRALQVPARKDEAGFPRPRRHAAEYYERYERRKFETVIKYLKNAHL
jgi:hypothetical protein